MKNLVLFGFMGSGKSTIGKLVAEKLNLEFVDMDKRLEEKHGCTIEEMFSVQGEVFFRDAESDLVKELSQQQGLLVSTGGGVVLRPENMKEFSSNSVMILLRVDAETSFKRTRGSQRPLLTSADPGSRIRELMEKRKSFYDRIPDAVDTVDRPLPKIVEEVVKIYQLQTGASNPT